MAIADDVDRVFRRYLEYLRAWGLLGVLAAYRRVDLDNIAESFALVNRRVEALYGAVTMAALEATDEYLYLSAAVAGKPFVGDWARGRPQAPRLLPSGLAVADYQARAPYGVMALVGSGTSPQAAVEVSMSRAATIVATAAVEPARSTVWARFLVDALVGHGRDLPFDLQPFFDEVEQYANQPRWDGMAYRDYGTTLTRYQRVPSPGACGFCLTLATRTNYTSADAAMYAGGGEGVQRQVQVGSNRVNNWGVQRRRSSSMESGARFHRNCRCTVRVSTGVPAISQADYLRLSTRDANGDLPVFGIGRHRYTVENFDWDVGGRGVSMPTRADWAGAWRSAPARARRAARRAAADAPPGVTVADWLAGDY